MGFSRWDTVSTRAAYASASSVRETKSRDQIFTSRHLKESMDPSKVLLRESRDSDFNPTSTAIIIALDVTGSMGIIAEKLARGKLGQLMEGIFARKPVADPQIMVMGVGDAFHDYSPLQTSQFEADIKIDASLQDLYLEGGGGGNNFESYDLPWFFAASRTAIDCFEKRGKKGYLFTIGDELPPQRDMNDTQIKSIFGKTQDVPKSSVEALALAQEKYDVFHVVVEQGSFASRDKGRVNDAWRELLGRRSIALDNWENITEVMIAAMELNEGKDINDVLENQQSESVKRSIRHAFPVEQVA